MDKGKRISIGVAGLDRVLSGGLLTDRNYLVRGGPGTGKTTLGLQFLTAQPDEPALFLTLGESVAQLRADASNQGFDLSGVRFVDLAPARGDTDELDDNYALLAPSEAETNPIGQCVSDAIEDLRPRRIFIDSLSHLAYLAPDAFQYRKQVMALLRYLTRQGCTVLAAAEVVDGARGDEELSFLTDGIIQLGWSGSRRVISIPKYRGSGCMRGEHTLRLDDHGMTCYPRLDPGEYHHSHQRETITSGISGVDRLMGGGLTRGTVTIISGPTGVGKTTLGLQFLHAAASNNRRSLLYTFEENLQTLLFRAEATGMPFHDLISGGHIEVESIEPLRYSSDEFTERLRHQVEETGAKVVMIDSLSGYRLSVAGDDLVRRIMAICRYLTNMGVTVILVNEISNIAGEEIQVTEKGISFLADMVIMLRYMEVRGELRKAIGILKKRTGDFERTLREFDITEDGIQVGQPLTRLRGILSGKPDFVAPDDIAVQD